MRILKNTLYIALLATSLSTTFTSCNSFLEVKPTDALLADNAIYDAKTARALVNSAYSNLKSYSGNNALILALLPSDNIDFGGSQAQNIELDNHAFTVTNSAIVAAYAANYTIINITNWAIAEIHKVQDPTFATGEQDKLVGEAHFIRALAYFNLVKGWGGVQLQLNPTTSLAALGDIPRSTEEDTYKQILADLDKAEALLPEDDTYTRNKVQKSIVKALRAKVYLYTKQFDLAEQEANGVLNKSKYELVQPYSAFFQAPFLSKESVFEMSATPNDAGVSSTIWLPASGTPRGSYELIPSAEIVSLLNDAAIGGNRYEAIAKRGTDNYVNLYTTLSPTINSSFVIRIADLYLIRAESRLRKSSPDLSGAIADLNIIRNRAEATLYPTTAVNSEDLLKAIWQERRLEFAFEADRWHDLVRTEQAEEVLGVDRNFWKFPIPQVDILSDPSLNGTNNSGY